MCFRPPKPPPAAPLPQAPPIQPRLSNNRALNQDELPTKKELIDEDAVSDVSYGTTPREGGLAESNQAGTKSLLIDIDKTTGGTSATQSTAGSGGLNV